MKLNEEAQAEWLTSSHYHRMKFTDLISPSSSYTKLTATLPRKHASWILQLRTGHFPVTKYLFHIGRAHSPTCPDCLQEVNSIHHLILQCPVHQLARAELHHALGDRDIKLNCMLTKPKPMKALIKFLAHTGRWMHDPQHPQNEQHDQQNWHRLLTQITTVIVTHTNPQPSFPSFLFSLLYFSPSYLFSLYYDTVTYLLTYPTYLWTLHTLVNTYNSKFEPINTMSMPEKIWKNRLVTKINEQMKHTWACC